MAQAKSQKASRNIPEHVKRAVRARDQNRCRNCGVVTEFIHYDHIFPFDLGGPNTVENVQSLCPTCNTSKGNKITCRHCGHWMSPDKRTCSQCGAPLGYTKYANTLAGRMENFFQRVGRAVVIGGAALALLVFTAAGLYVANAFRGPSGDPPDDSAAVEQIVNTSFGVTRARPAYFPVRIPAGAKNARVVGGYKVTSGGAVNFYVFDEAQYGRWSAGDSGASAVTQRSPSSSLRVRQALKPGSYFLVFGGAGEAEAKTVAAEFYLKYD